MALNCRFRKGSMSQEYDYDEWFFDNILENATKYSAEQGGDADTVKERAMKIVDMYSNSYESDENFENWCRDYADYLGQVSYDNWVENQVDELREERIKND